MVTIKGTIKAVSGPNLFEGVMQIGFVLVEDPDTWHNIAGQESLLKEILETKVKKGNEIEFDKDENKNITNMTLIKATEDKWEDDMVTFEDLLTKAHKLKEKFSIRTRMLEFDLEKKFALFKATVIIAEGKLGEAEIAKQVFEGHGDATADNVTGEFIKPHFIRMAETRAIVRALRWYTNNACAEEEK